MALNGRAEQCLPLGKREVGQRVSEKLPHLS